MSFNNLRKGRFSEEGRIYFVTMVTQNRNTYLSEFYLARAVIHELRFLHDEQKIHSLAWVVMPDHLHWLFQLNENEQLSNIINLLKGRVSRKVNKMLNKKGKFWQSAYYDHALRKDEDIKKVARYIVANPFRAGLVEKIEDYPHWDADWL